MKFKVIIFRERLRFAVKNYENWTVLISDFTAFFETLYLGNKTFPTSRIF